MDTDTPHEGDWRARSPAGVADAFRASPQSRLARPRLLSAHTARVGRRATVRWSTMNAGDAVQRWRVYLNGRLVRTVSSSERRRIVRERIRRAGRFRWTVHGFDGQGAKVASASRSFRAKRS